MKFFGQPHVRRFGVDTRRAMIVYQKASGRVKDLCEIPEFPGGPKTQEELQERGRELQGRKFQRLSGRRHDGDVIATTPDSKPVSKKQIEDVFNDWILLNTICGQGVYEHVANAHELQVLAIARKMYGA